MSVSRRTTTTRAVSFTAEEVAARNEEAIREEAADNAERNALRDEAQLRNGGQNNDNVALPASQILNNSSLTRSQTPRSQPGLSNLQNIVAVHHAPQEGQSFLFGRANARIDEGGRSSFNTMGQTPAAPGVMVIFFKTS